MLAGVLTYIRHHHLAFLALFIALGGTAWAIEANSVKSKHIVNGQVKEADLGNDAVTAGKVGENALGTDQIDESTLFNDDSLDDADLAAAEGPHLIGGDGEPPFRQNDGFCPWQNFDTGGHQPAAFFRDAFGFVHIQGLVKATNNNCDFSFGDNNIFELPAGYRPASRSVHSIVANDTGRRVNVDPTGLVGVDTSVPLGDIVAFVSLDGISFRCAPSGQDGCP